MGTAATAAARANSTINIKRQSFYVRPQVDATNRDEVETLWPRGADGVKFLRDLNAFVQEQKELENNEASSSKDPRKKDYGAYSPLTQTAPLYAKPVGLAQGDLPIEDSILSLFFTAKAERPAGTATVESATDAKTLKFATDITADYVVGMAVYVGTVSTAIRHIAAIDFGVTTGGKTTIALSANLDSVPVGGEVMEAGPVVYYFDDNAGIPLANLIAQSDSVVDVVTSMFISAWNMEGGNDAYLTHSFDIGGIKVFSGVQGNFMANNVDPIDTAVYDNISTIYDVGGIILANEVGGLPVGSTSINVDDTTTDLDDIIPAGLYVKIVHDSGGTPVTRYYLTASGGDLNTLKLAEPITEPIVDNDVITVHATGNWRFATTEGDGVIEVLTQPTIGDTEVAISDSNGTPADLDVAPVEGVPVFIDGHQYWTAADSTVALLKLTTPIQTAPATGTTVHFATESKVGMVDVSHLDAYIAFKNSTTGELFMAPETGGLVDKGAGVFGFDNWDAVNNKIQKVWRGMGGTSVQAILNYDDLDLYFPASTSADGSPIQARKDVATYVGDTKITTKIVRMGINKNAAADEEERSLDDYAGLPEDDVREYTLEIEANFKPDFFAKRYEAITKATTSLQTTIGAVKSRRVSVFIPKMTLAVPTKDAGDKKMTTVLRANVFQDVDAPAFYLAFC